MLKSFIFQSTGSLRSPTKRDNPQLFKWNFQSTGSLRSPTWCMALITFFIILSIHKPLAEPDSVTYCNRLFYQRFQSTGSLRSPTWMILMITCLIMLSIHRLLAEPDEWSIYFFKSKPLSIHRLLAEPDTRSCIFIKPPITFNPQAPCGARRKLSHPFK